MANKLVVYNVEDQETGKIYKVEGPEGATPDELGEFVLSQRSAPSAVSAPQAPTITPSISVGVGQSSLPQTVTEAVQAGSEKAPANIGFGVEDQAQINAMMQDPSIPYETIDQYVRETAKARQLPYMSLGGSVEDLAKYRQGLAQGASAQDFAYQAAIAPQVESSLPSLEKRSLAGPQWLDRMFNALDRGYEDAVQYGTPGWLARTYHDWMDTGMDQLRQMYPDATPEQLENIHSTYISEVQKELRAANQIETENDPLVPWLAGQLIGSVGVEDFAPGALGAKVGTRIGSGALINMAADAGYQGLDVAEGVQEEFNPEQLLLSGVLGGGLQAGLAGVDRLAGGSRRIDETPLPEEASSTINIPTGSTRSKEYKESLTAAKTQIGEHVTRTTENWTNAPEFDIHDNFRKVKGLDNDALGAVTPDGRVAFNTEMILKTAKKAGVNPEDVINAVTYHEMLGHHGLAQKFGEDLDGVLDSFYDSGLTSFRSRVDDWLEKNPDTYKGQADRQTRAIEEVLAEMSDKGQLPVAFKDRLFNFLKDFGRRVGIDLRYSDREIKTILGMAHSAVIKGKNRDVVANGFRYTYGGVRAKIGSWPEEKGRPQDWFTGPDDVERFEIDDSASRFDEELFRDAATPDETSLKLGDVLDHPELYEAYPELRKYPITSLPESQGLGLFDERRKVIRIAKSVEDKRSTALHEIQHAIQSIEDMGRGGNPETALDFVSIPQLQDTLRNLNEWDRQRLEADTNKLNLLNQIANTAEADAYNYLYNSEQTVRMLREDARKKLDREDPWNDPYYAQLMKEHEELQQKVWQAEDDVKKAIGVPSDLSSLSRAEKETWWDIQNVITSSDMGRTLLMGQDRLLKMEEDLASAERAVTSKDRDTLRKHVMRFRTSEVNRNSIEYQAYESIFGEVEARDVQARRDMTKEERRQIRPYSSQDEVAPPSSYIVHRWRALSKEVRQKMAVDSFSKGGNTPDDPAVLKTAELFGIPKDRIPKALTERDFLGQVFLTRREMSKATTKYMKSFTTEEDDIRIARKILTDVLEDYEPTYRSWAEAKRAARDRGMTATQIRKAKGVGDLDKRIFQYDAAAQVTSERLSELNAKLESGNFTAKDKAEYLKTTFAYNEMLGRIFDDQAEIGRALSAMRAIQHTRNKYGKLNEILAELQNSPLKAFADDDTFNKFAKNIQTLMDSGNTKGALSQLASITKPYWWQYGLSFRHSMMLSGIGTQAKNAKDNAMMIARELEEQVMASPLQALRGAMRTAGLDVKEGVSPQEVAGRAYGLLSALLDGGTYKDTARAFMKGHDNRTISSKVEMADARIPVLSKVQDTLHAADTFFRAFHKNANLYTLGVRKAREDGFTGLTALQEGSNRAYQPSKDLLDEANNLTDVALLVDTPSLLSSKLEAVKAIRPGMDAGEQALAFTANLLFPFFRVTDRLLFQALRRSPLAFLDRVTREDLAAGGARMDIAIARMAYGSALMYYYWNQAGEGEVTGNGPADYKKRQALEAGGWMPNATKEGSQYVDASGVNLSFLPDALNNSIATQIASLREAYDEGQADAGTTAEALGSVMLELGTILSSQSFAENLSTYLEPFAAGDEMSKDTAIANVVGGMASSFIPAALRQYNQAVHDPIKRDTTGDRSISDRIYGRVASGVPGLSEQLPARYDLYGDEVQQGRSISGLQNYRDIKTDDVSKELQRLESTTDKPVVTGAPSSFKYEGETIKLSAEGKQEWQRVQGYYLREFMKEEMADPAWKSYSVDDQIALVKQAKKDAYEETKYYMLPLLGLEESEEMGDEEDAE